MSELWLLGVLALMVAAVGRASRPVIDGDWWWPIPDIEQAGVTSRAVVSQEFRGGGANPHYGVDLMYLNGAAPPLFTAPPGVPILAARAGRLWSATRTPRGWAVVIDHGPPWASFYQHLEELSPEIATAAEQGNVGKSKHGGGLQVAAGQRLGTMGSDPTDGGHVRHLHFALWYRGSGDGASVDPAQAMTTWRRSKWTL